MRIELNEDQKLIQESAADFAIKHVKPIAAELDETQEFPVALLPKLAEMGFMGIAVPEEYGGAGLDYVSYVLVMEELARYCGTTSVIVSVNNSLACEPILTYGTEEQKQEFLTPLASGEKLGCFALTEPNSGSDCGSMKTYAKREGEDWILNGAKIFITCATNAQTAIVFTSTNPSQGNRGITAFIVDMDQPGVSVKTMHGKMGIRASGLAEIVFEDVKVPDSNRLGEVDKGVKIAMTTLNAGRIGIAAQAVGISRGAMEESIQYSSERQQFGKPIGKFQAIQFFLADMAVRIDASRLLTLKACTLKDKGENYNNLSAMAKLLAGETATWVTNKAVQVHGGYGYIKEYNVERYFRDARITEIYEGTSEIQKVVISRELLG
ncbi:acyl-CoA dehydrogenase [bacterium]|nr:acyl-CoA dehydrogenase [bacterium]